MPINPTGAARIHLDQLTKQHPFDKLTSQRGPGVGYTRDFSEYSAGKKFFKIASYLFVVPLVIDAVRGKFQRRLTISGEALPAPIDTHINRTDWKKVLAVSRNPQQLAQAGSAREQHLRSIAIKLIGATGQDHGGLKTALRSPDVTTTDLVELAVNCAHDKTGEYRQAVFDSLRSDLKQEHATTDRSARFEAMRQELVQADEASAQIDQVQSLPASTKGLNIGAMLDEKTLQDMGKKLKVKPEHFDQIRPLIAKLVAMPQGTPEVRAQWLQQLVNDHKDAVRLLCLMPMLMNSEGMGDLGPLKAIINKDRPMIDALRTALGLKASAEVVVKAPEKAATKPVKAGFLGSMMKKMADAGQALAPFKEMGQIDKAISGLAVDGPRAQALADAIDQKFVQDYDFSVYTGQLDGMIQGLPPEMEDLLKNVVQRYFQEQTPADKKAMLASLYEHGNSTEPMDHLVALLKGAGPFLQKIVQHMGSNVSNPRIAKALQQLKEDLNPIDDQERLVLLNQVMKRIGAQGARMTDIRVLSSASVAETVTVKLVTSGAEGEPEKSREVVVKLLRPGIESRAGRERAFFDRIAEERKLLNPDDAMAKTMGSVADQIEGELDLRMEAEQISAAQVYRGSRQTDGGLIRVMQRSTDYQPEAEFLILEKMPGRSVKSFITEAQAAASDPVTSEQRLAEMEGQCVQLCERLSALGAMWLSELSFGSGFFHGDLHAGNLMVEANANDPVKLGLIDFGNAGTLEPAQRRNLLRLQAAVMQLHPRLAVEALRELLPVATQGKFDQLRDQLVLELQGLMLRDNDNLLKGDVLNAFLSAGSELGLEIPGPVLQVGRSQGMLDATFNDAHKALSELVKRRDPNAKPTVAADALEAALESAVTSKHRRMMGAAGWGFTLSIARQGNLQPMLQTFKQHPAGLAYEAAEEVAAAARKDHEAAVEDARSIRQGHFKILTATAQGLFMDFLKADDEATRDLEQQRILDNLPEPLKSITKLNEFLELVRMAPAANTTNYWKPHLDLLTHFEIRELFDQFEAADLEVNKLRSEKVPESNYPDLVVAVVAHERQVRKQQAASAPVQAPPAAPGLAAQLMGAVVQEPIEAIGELQTV